MEAVEGRSFPETEKGQSSKAGKVPVLVKILKYPVGFLIIIYDAVTWDPHGVGTKVLVAVASSIDMYNNDVGKRFMK